MATASPSFANTPQGLRRSPRTLKREGIDNAQKTYCIKAEVSLGLETGPDVAQDRSDFEPQKAVEAPSRKRQRTGFDFSQSEEPSKRGKRVYRTTEQHKEVLSFRDDRIRSLEEENKTLKNKIEGLKKQLSKEVTCPICGKLYKRSDGLYNHLQRGDEEHKRLAQERYENTKCETCGKECARWGDLKKHMAVHEQKVVGSAVELNVEPDASKFLIATSASIVE